MYLDAILLCPFVFNIKIISEIKQYGSSTCTALNSPRYNMSNEPRCEKPVFGVSDQVRHKPDWTVTEDG